MTKGYLYRVTLTKSLLPSVNTSSGQVAATNAYQFLFDFVKCVQVGSGCSRFQDDCACKQARYQFLSHFKSGCIHVVDRPGHPFLGNDFYRVCGDVFGRCPSCFWFT